MDLGVTRRTVLKSAAAAAVFSVVPVRVLGGEGRTPPSGKVTLAGIGVGGVGFGQLQACESAGLQLVALCDVDDVYADKAYKKWPQARRHRDFREMLDKETGLDAVHVATPDHTHAVATLAALRKRKHVCCVKPLTRTIYESRAVVEAARRAKVATQVTASPNTGDAGCATCEMIWDGAIGDVQEVHIWTNRPLWPQGMARPPGAESVPATFDWNLWLGPAPARPFKDKWPEDALALDQINAGRPKGRSRDGVYHPWNFRGWWDFGTGALGDMGCHRFNIPRRALKLGHPASVQATSTRVLPETAPLASIVTWDFPAREGLPPVRVNWYDGGLKPPRPRDLEGDRALSPEGVLYVGTKGTMLDTRIIPESKMKAYRLPPKTLPRRPGTWGEWVEAIRGGEPAGCAFDWAGPLTELILLGNIAIRTGKRLEWDGAAMRFTNDTEANRFVKEPYHNGWSLEA